MPAGASTPVPLRIDFVSDVSCPWCVIGLKALERALEKLRGEVAAEIHFQPFELNPHMVREGQDIDEHLRQKYGSSPAQLQQGRDALRARGESLGFEFRMDQRRRVYNTFDAHRLLHWAGLAGHQHALKHALFRAYFTDGDDPSSHATLVRLAGEVGLDPERARRLLASDEFAAEVRAQERFYLGHGINAVPAVIFDNRQLISGGQPVEVFERALREIAASIAAARGAQETAAGVHPAETRGPL